MATPYLNTAKTWLICTPVAATNPFGITGDPHVGKSSTLAVSVSRIIAVTDIVSSYDNNSQPLFAAGVNILIEGRGWVTIEGTRANIATLLGIIG